MVWARNINKSDYSGRIRPIPHIRPFTKDQKQPIFLLARRVKTQRQFNPMKRINF